jgi:predicted ATPase/transcriptional regulator with XRE-family HTH domain
MEAVGRPNFGALLRQFRLDAGMTQQDLAERANLSVEAIGALERGIRTRPQRETVALLGDALSLSPEREVLLRSVVRAGHPPRRRDHDGGPRPTQLRAVGPDTKRIANSNLPQPLTSFVGRQREVAEIAALLRTYGLVTIVGPGGVGKTRVALQTANALLDECPDGARLVDLAPLPDQALVAGEILNALQLPLSSGSALNVVMAYLKTRRVLLILDNCEHVILHVREVVNAIGQSCPRVLVMSTSRQALDASGERVYRLLSLAVPPDSCRTAREALTYGGVELFSDRAQTVNPRFALSADNMDSVVEICRRLDGIPLAIELAAARVNVLAPHQIAQRLDHRFRLLTTEDPVALRRHQTMTTLFDWSYDLLSAREQRLFNCLSVFAGGCTLEAATAVCATGGEDDIDVVNVIASLVMKSLVVAELAGNEQRYHLLESSRAYARQKLEAHGAQEQTARRHAVTYLELAEQLERTAITEPDGAWLPHVLVELENWRIALEWTLGRHRDVIVGQRLAASRRLGWALPAAELQRWVHDALKLVDERTPLSIVAQLHLAEATFAHQLAQHHVCLVAAEKALGMYREVGSARGIALCQSYAGGALAFLGRYAQAEPLLEDALLAARMLGDRRLMADILLRIGWNRSALDDFDGARTHLTEALRVAKSAGAESFALVIQSTLAQNEFDDGHHEMALRLMDEVLAIRRTMKYTYVVPSMATNLVNLAGFLVKLNRYDEAGVHAKEALELTRGHDLVVLLALSLRIIALVALKRLAPDGHQRAGILACVARLFGFVEARLRPLDTMKKHGLQEECDRALAALQEQIGGDKLAQLMAAGATMTENDAIDEAYAIQ